MLIQELILESFNKESKINNQLTLLVRIPHKQSLF